MYFSELELAEIYGSGQKTGKQNLQVFLTRAVYFSELELAEIYGSGQKPENNIFKFFDPRHVFQRARACRDIRFGSKNRKTKSSSFLARAEYFSELELAEIYGSGQKPENKIVMFCDPRRVFQRARACRNIQFGSKNRKAKSSSFLTLPLDGPRP